MNGIEIFRKDMRRPIITFQVPYKAVLLSLYEYALKNENEELKRKIKSVFDLRFDNIPQRFRSLGLDDSLVVPSNVIIWHLYRIKSD